MDERSRFIDAHLAGGFTMSELCQQAQISRRTGYKWLARYDEEGRAGLRDRSRAPHHCPHRMSAAVAQLLCAARKKHPDWGPRKLLGWLAPRHPEIEHWPANSTAGDLLHRLGFVKPRRKRYRPIHPGVIPAVTEAPNDLWTADFKGQFPTTDRVYCYPITVADLHTRYLLACHGLRSTASPGAQRVFERLFREYGLPRAIRTDNGVPFATNGLHGLSELNVWWLRLGILHQRIHPASPQENGAHERMHKTLKLGAIRPARASLRAQQRAFNRFRDLYNDERPHEALDDCTPASRFIPSPRVYPNRLPAIDYPRHFVVRPVSAAGNIHFKNAQHFLGRVLNQQPVGLEEIDNGVWSIYFCHLLVARFDEPSHQLIRA